MEKILTIAICGIDGGGKSTIIKEMEQWLAEIYRVSVISPLKIATDLSNKSRFK